MPGNRMASRSAIPSRSINSTHFFSRNPVSTRAESFNQRAGQIQQMVRQGPTGAANYGARGANSTERSGNAAGGGYGNTNRSGFANPRAANPQGSSSLRARRIRRAGRLGATTMAATARCGLSRPRITSPGRALRSRAAGRVPRGRTRPRHRTEAEGGMLRPRALPHRAGANGRERGPMAVTVAVLR